MMFSIGGLICEFCSTFVNVEQETVSFQCLSINKLVSIISDNAEFLR